MIGKPLIVILSLAGLFTAIVALDPGHYFTLDYLQSQYGALMAYRLQHPLVAMALYFLLHVLVTGLSLPAWLRRSSCSRSCSPPVKAIRRARPRR